MKYLVELDSITEANVSPVPKNVICLSCQTTGLYSSQSFSHSTDSGYGSSFSSLPPDANSSVKTYVDNPKNRQLGRVGQPYGSSSGSQDLC